MRRVQNRESYLSLVIPRKTAVIANELSFFLEGRGWRKPRVFFWET